MIPCSDQEYYYKLDNMVLSSSQHLRQVFKNRWKAESGEDWIDDDQHRQQFCDGLGKSALKKAPQFQKNSLKTTEVEEWDTSLLALVIQNFGSDPKYEQENVAVKNLKDLRNELAHHSTKQITKGEYEEMCDGFKCSLKSLGMEIAKIDKLVDRSGVTSSLKAFECVKSLHEKAEEFKKRREYDKAVNCYNEAIETPSLLPVNLCTAYEKRAEYHIDITKDALTETDNLNSALLDITKALELNEYSWSAHYIAARCHRLKNDYPLAIHHYQKALSISPVQKKVKNDLDTCKLLAGIQSRKDHLNPAMMPMNLTERVAHFNDETGANFAEKDFLFHEETLKPLMFKGQDHVFNGHKYMCGWGVPQNFQEAARYYTKAYKVKNPEGMYNLGKCYHEGHGVEQSIEEALRIYREVAALDPKTPGQETALKCNVGVAAAQHVLGVSYNYGVGVLQDYSEAAKWYGQAMSNGSGHAANNLGILYSKGQGVPRNDKMAAECWKQGVALKDVNAAHSLVGHYMRQLEPDQALEMLKIGRKMGNATLINLPDEEFDKEMLEVKRCRQKIEPQVLEYEMANKLDVKGLTFQERVNRVMRGVDPNISKLKEVFEKTMHGNPGEPDSWGGKVQPFGGKVLEAIGKRADEGSLTAQRTLETLEYLVEMCDLIERKMFHSEKEKMDILELVYKCVTLNHHLIMCPPETNQKLKSILSDLADRKCDKKGDEDMKIRLCYTTINLFGSASSNDMYGVEMLKIGIQRYPENITYYNIMSGLLGLKQKSELGLHYAEEGLKVEPDNADLLYDRAVHLFHYKSKCGTKELSKSKDECVEAYKTFLRFAPFEHRKVPEAHYQISHLYLSDIEKAKGGFVESKQFRLLKEHFKRGKEAEKWQLPCYLPYGSSDIKQMLEALISALEHGPVKNAVPPANITPVPKSIYDRKPYLKSPTRKSLIGIHRENLAKYSEMAQKKLVLIKDSAVPKLTQTVAKTLIGIEPITLQEMNPTEDHIFEDRFLELTIIEDPNPHYPSIHLVAEDNNGDTTILYIYNVDRETKTVAHFGAGCRIAIINPYMRIASQHISNGIRNDEPKCILFLKKVDSMCRFCGSENAEKKCSKCKRAYCSEECQKQDWKELNHKMICKVKY